MSKKKFDIIIPSVGIKPSGHAMPLKPAPEKMRTKDNTTSDTSKNKNGSQKK